MANHERTHYPLTLSVSLDDGLVLEFSHDRAHFTDAVVQRLAGHLTRLIGLMAAQPHAALGSLDYLAADERQQLVEAWSRATLDCPSERFVHELFATQAAVTPDAAALLFEDHELSHAELNLRANRLARHLMALGVGPDVRVGLAVERGPELVIGLLAVLGRRCLCAAGPGLPGRPPAVHDRGQRRGTGADPAERARQPAGPRRPATPVPDQGDAWQGLEGSDPQVRLHPHNLAYVMFTSGSTGAPRA